jgi:hypothetical protein
VAGSPVRQEELRHVRRARRSKGLGTSLVHHDPEPIRGGPCLPSRPSAGKSPEAPPRPPERIHGPRERSSGAVPQPVLPSLPLSGIGEVRIRGDVPRPGMCPSMSRSGESRRFPRTNPSA